MPNRPLSVNHPEAESTLLYDILDSLSEPVIAFNDTGNAFYSNQAAKQQFDLTPVQTESATWNLGPHLYFPDGLRPYPIPQLPCFADHANEKDIPLIFRLKGQSPAPLRCEASALSLRQAIVAPGLRWPRPLIGRQAT